MAKRKFLRALEEKLKAEIVKLIEEAGLEYEIDEIVAFGEDYFGIKIGIYPWGKTIMEGSYQEIIDAVKDIIEETQTGRKFKCICNREYDLTDLQEKTIIECECGSKIVCPSTFEVGKKGKKIPILVWDLVGKYIPKEILDIIDLEYIKENFYPDVFFDGVHFKNVIGNRVYIIEPHVEVSNEIKEVVRMVKDLREKQLREILGNKTQKVLLPYREEDTVEKDFMSCYDCKYYQYFNDEEFCVYPEADIEEKFEKELDFSIFEPIAAKCLLNMSQLEMAMKTIFPEDWNICLCPKFEPFDETLLEEYDKRMEVEFPPLIQALEIAKRKQELAEIEKKFDEAYLDEKIQPLSERWYTMRDEFWTQRGAGIKNTRVIDISKIERTMSQVRIEDRTYIHEIIKELVHLIKNDEKLKEIINKHSPYILSKYLLTFSNKEKEFIIEKIHSYFVA